MSYRFLIVGAGPSGLYASRFLSKHFGKTAALDMLEKELLPGGLLRWGVAPDHPELRSSISHFDELFKTPTFNYFGGVHLKPGVAHQSLYSGYSAVILSTGAEITKKTHFQNENSVADRVFDSTEFFHLYNGKPSQTDAKFAAIKGAKKMVIVGNGNVTIDMIRLFTRSYESLNANDRVNPQFTHFLSENALEQIQVVGRRGVVQAACAVKEMKDLAVESTFKLTVPRDEYERSMTPGSIAECDDKIELSRRQNRKKAKLFEEMTKVESKSGQKEIRFRFLLEPISVELRDGKRYLKCAKMALVDDPKGAKIKPIEGQFEEIEFDILVKNLGFEVEKPDLFETAKESSAPVLKAGWAFSKGKGTIADLINDSGNKSLRLLQEANEGKLKTMEATSYFEQLLTEPSAKELFSGNRLPSHILDREGYLRFRELEVQKKMEIVDPTALKPFLRALSKVA